MIPTTRPFLDSSDIRILKNVISSKILVDGMYQEKVEKIIKKKINSKFIAVTQSCTDALEISAILLNLKKNDEVIMPSYNFVSMANAIFLRGARPVFVDVDSDTLNIKVDEIEKAITKRTKAIFVVHYAGNACNMSEIIKIKNKYKLTLVEDCAHSLFAKHKNQYLGTIGDIGVFSFHETKNFVSGQGGAISINNVKLIKRTNFILDKGTDRKDVINNNKKIVDEKNNKKFYSWVDIGSEYRLDELRCAILYNQLNKADYIKKKRKKLYLNYCEILQEYKNKNFFDIIKVPQNSESSYHLMILIFKKEIIARKFRKFLQSKNIAATFHYIPLHLSKMGRKFYKKKIKNTERIYKNIVRMPFYTDMNKKDFFIIKKNIHNFFKNY